MPVDALSWRRAIQFAPDASLDPAWFQSFETSIYNGENSIDLQSINRSADSYDFMSLSSVLEFVPDDRRAFAELARVGSDRCIVHSTFLSSLDAPTSTHFGAPYGTFGRYHDYGRDLGDWFETDRLGMSTLLVRTVDPVSMDTTPVHFFCRDDRDIVILQNAFASGEPLEVSVISRPA